MIASMWQSLTSSSVLKAEQVREANERARPSEEEGTTW